MMIRILIAAVLQLFVAGSVLAQFSVGTAFTYQGSLAEGGVGANGSFDFEIKIFDAATDGNELAPSVLADATSVVDGIFTVTLDFGDVFDSVQPYLEIAVREASGTEYQVLSPRQAISPVPYALLAARASEADFVNGDGVQTASIQDGSVTPGKLSSTARSTLDASDGVPSAAVAVTADGDLQAIGNVSTSATVQAGLVLAGAVNATGNVNGATVSGGTVTGVTVTASGALSANSATIDNALNAQSVVAPNVLHNFTVEGPYTTGFMAIENFNTENVVNMTAVSNSFCFLTLVRVGDDNNEDDTTQCEVEAAAGTWQLRGRTSADEASGECRARCLSWHNQ